MITYKVPYMYKLQIITLWITCTITCNCFCRTFKNGIYTVRPVAPEPPDEVGTSSTNGPERSAAFQSSTPIPTSVLAQRAELSRYGAACESCTVRPYFHSLSCVSEGNLLEIV